MSDFVCCAPAARPDVHPGVPGSEGLTLVIKFRELVSTEMTEVRFSRGKNFYKHAPLMMLLYLASLVKDIETNGLGMKR
jgi:hypothetical protein